MDTELKSMLGAYLDSRPDPKVKIDDEELKQIPLAILERYAEWFVLCKSLDKKTQDEADIKHQRIYDELERRNLK